MQAFWANGYAATSMSDLLEATGLHKGSLYQAFGDKHTLFARALSHYLEEMRRRKNERLASAPTPLDGIRSVAHGMVDLACADETCPKGCLGINSLVELAPHDPEVARILDQHTQLMRGSLEETIRKAQAEGQIRKDRAAELIAAMLMTFMAGLAALLRGPLTARQAHELLDAQFAAIT